MAANTNKSFRDLYLNGTGAIFEDFIAHSALLLTLIEIIASNIKTGFGIDHSLPRLQCEMRGDLRIYIAHRGLAY